MEKLVRTYIVGIPIGLLISYHFVYFFFTVEGEDFETGPYTIEFVNGTDLPASSCIAIDTFDDDDIEGDHNFELQIIYTSPTINVYMYSSQQEAVILDNDGNLAI